jgi:hypothetical protein
LKSASHGQRSAQTIPVRKRYKVEGKGDSGKSLIIFYQVPYTFTLSPFTNNNGHLQQGGHFTENALSKL